MAALAPKLEHNLFLRLPHLIENGGDMGNGLLLFELDSPAGGCIGNVGAHLRFIDARYRSQVLRGLHLRLYKTGGRRCCPALPDFP